MIRHVMLGTNDLVRARAFYDSLFATIGAVPVVENARGQVYYSSGQGKPMLAFGPPYDGRPATVGNGIMIALEASSREQVDQVHAKAMQLGAVDEGGPGPRGTRSDSGFYAAYFRDPDGNKLCICHWKAPDKR
jgi:catechol 2,3-dioxygenase-like lactoylglutathione lyase family enzyme